VAETSLEDFDRLVAINQVTRVAAVEFAGRIGEPADTAAVVAFLASAEAGFITGQVIYVVGGQHGPVRWAG
jgi:NAD(P)-dependent dehydrogenase (short-subunit alcohol dehydrogenase family)